MDASERVSFLVGSSIPTSGKSVNVQMLLELYLLCSKCDYIVA